MGFEIDAESDHSDRRLHDFKFRRWYRPMSAAASPPVQGFNQDGWKDAALVLVGHGSTLNAESAEPTHFHAEALRDRNLFGHVAVCFWKEQPVISAVLRGVLEPRVFIVPLFISDGYFTEQVIPRELGFCQNGELGWARIQRRNQQLLHYCEPVGTHPSMTEVILARASSVVMNHPDGSNAASAIPVAAESSLFIAGHGTGNNENSRKAIEAQVALVAARSLYRDVHAIFMEESPRIETAYDLALTENLVVVPFFIADGLHSDEDIPVLLGERPEDVRRRLKGGEPTWLNPTVRHGKRVWYSRSIGDEPRLADVILERVWEAATATRVGQERAPGLK